jgi:exodeoxyribonuclease-3
MKIASWNVNSLNVRLPHLLRWLETAQPDVVALQETKLEDAKFPDDAIAALGYRSVFSGQKTYNGVAILSREKAGDVQIDIPGFEDEQRRVIATTVGGVRFVNLYVVNGKAVGDAKFIHKLRWLAAVRDWLQAEIARHPQLVVLGDFNIAPDDRDVHDPKRWREKILCSTPERDALRRILELGLDDSFRLHHADGGHYSWWDYRLLAYDRGWGLRIDLVLVSKALRERCVAASIDLEPRGWERPSDHTPVVIELEMP